MTLLNLTPHPIHIYHHNVPDTLHSGRHGAVLLRTIDPHPDGPARVIEEADDNQPAFNLDGVPIYVINWQQPGPGINHGVRGLPERQRGVDLIVSRPVAMLSHGREDLLVQHRMVRLHDGTILGCRALASPW